MIDFGGLNHMHIAKRQFSAIMLETLIQTKRNLATSLQFVLDRSYLVCTDEVLTTARIFAAWRRAALLISILSLIVVIHSTDLFALDLIRSFILLSFPTALKNFFSVHIIIRRRWITNALLGNVSRLCSSSSNRSKRLFAYGENDHILSFIFFYQRGTKRRCLHILVVLSTPWSNQTWINGKYSSPTLSFANLLTLPHIEFTPYLVILTLEFATNKKSKIETQTTCKHTYSLSYSRQPSTELESPELLSLIYKFF